MAPLVGRSDFEAVLFALDGVLTTSRTIPAAAWQRVFDDFLHIWDARHDTRTPPFDVDSDYAAVVEGKPGQDGVRDFLSSRAIALPEGSPGSDPGEESVWGLANREQMLVEEALHQQGVEVFPGSVAWIRELREAGLATAVVSDNRKLRCCPCLRRPHQPLRCRRGR